MDNPKAIPSPNAYFYPPGVGFGSILATLARRPGRIGEDGVSPLKEMRERTLINKRLEGS